MKPKIINRLCGILKFEKVEYDEKIISELVNDHYPDMRKMIGLLQQYSKQMGIIDKGIFSYDAIDTDLYNLIFPESAFYALLT